jgi:protein TonB
VALWLAVGVALPSRAASQPADERLPAFGEYVFVEELPEVVRQVAPVYPEAARRAGVQGDVLVQVLVGRDGRVRDARVVRSIPPLDSCAVAAVRQWVFKPALVAGQPVAAWVAVPVQFRVGPGQGAGAAETLRTPPPPRSPEVFESDLAALRAGGLRLPGPADSGLRRRLIAGSLKLTPGLSVPPAASRHLARVESLMALPDAPERDRLAETELTQAFDWAPWWGALYRRAAELERRRGRYAEARVDLQLYLLAEPDAPDRTSAQAELHELERKLARRPPSPARRR